MWHTHFEGRFAASTAAALLDLRAGGMQVLSAGACLEARDLACCRFHVHVGVSRRHATRSRCSIDKMRAPCSVSYTTIHTRQSRVAFALAGIYACTARFICAHPHTVPQFTLPGGTRRRRLSAAAERHSACSAAGRGNINDCPQRAERSRIGAGAALHGTCVEWHCAGACSRTRWVSHRNISLPHISVERLTRVDRLSHSGTAMGPTIFRVLALVPACMRTRTHAPARPRTGQPTRSCNAAQCAATLQRPLLARSPRQGRRPSHSRRLGRTAGLCCRMQRATQSLCMRAASRHRALSSWP